MKLLVAYETQIKKTGKEVHIGGKSKKGQSCKIPAFHIKI